MEFFKIEEQEHGQRLSYDPTWQGPMKVSREKTDPRALKFYLTTLIIWLGIGAFGCISWLDPKQQDIAEDIEFRTFNRSFIINISHPENYDVLQHVFLHFPAETFRMMFYNPVEFLSTIGYSVFAAVLSIAFIWFFRHRAKIVVQCILGFYCFCLMLAILGSFLIGGSMIVTGIIFSVILTGIVMFIVKFRRKIKLSCKIVNVASKIAFFTPYHYLVVLGQFLLSLTAFMYFANNIRLLSDFYKNTEEPHGPAFFIFIILLHLGNFVAWLWTSNFIYSVEILILSGSFSTWYWTLNKETVPQNTVQHFTRAVWNNHLGTVAIGSIYMSVIDVLVFFFDIITEVVGEIPKICGVLLESFSSCGSLLTYGVWCVSRDAFVICALHSQDFHASGKKAYHLMRRNFLKFTVTYLSFLLFQIVGFLAVTIPMLFVIFRIPHDNFNIDELYFIAITFIFVYHISNALNHLFQVAVDSTFVNVLEDYEKNDGSVERPFYMSEKLKKFILR